MAPPVAQAESGAILEESEELLGAAPGEQAAVQEESGGPLGG